MWIYLREGNGVGKWCPDFWSLQHPWEFLSLCLLSLQIFPKHRELQRGSQTLILTVAWGQPREGVGRQCNRGVFMLGEIKLIRTLKSLKRCGNGCNKGLQNPHLQGAGKCKVNSVAKGKETPGCMLLGDRVLLRPKRLNYFSRSWTKSWGDAH